eukprot:TRINITY_DN27983_c0_g1_i1.p1 TRINITY_DN27983_c0_g1~~TRINITY_DN27983_c0_g1_i1.p1  ORF type:complete len:506 (-),score=53.38 TRINITY_DN27983_c0_g1_i1:87-1388(-)
MEAVRRVLVTDSKVILSGYPKWKSGVEHLKGCGARIDLVIILSPFDAEALAQRAELRHLKGERPEDDHSNFQARLEAYEDNRQGILEELSTMCDRIMNINPMANPCFVASVAIDRALKACPFLAVQDRSNPFGAASQASSSRGRSACFEGSGDAQQRRDPSEADIEVSFRLLSGEEIAQHMVSPRSPIKGLKALLAAGGENADLELFYLGESLCDEPVISELNGFQSGDVINVVRIEKPPPPRWDGNTHCIAGRCFSPDSVVRVLEGGKEVKRCFMHVKVGDMVRTGHGQGPDTFRRVQHVWRHPPLPSEEPLPAFELAEGCRITIGHPAMIDGVWRKPESVCRDAASFETVVYQLEIEGHVDTVLVGSGTGVVCALLGRYCGEDFGWNIFTRKTVRCDKQPCRKCAKACLPGLTFDHSKLTQQMLQARYEPY